MLSLFGIVPGSALNFADVKAGKYDCIETLSASQPLSFMKMHDTKPKPGSDFCLKTDPFAVGNSAETAVASVYFSQDIPFGFNNVKVELHKRTGNIDNITANTWGQDIRAIYALLVQKYGQPDGDPVVHMQNGFGATFDKYLASWTFSDGATLTWDSGSDAKQDAGRLRAIAADVARDIEARQKAAKANEHGL
jgi:hypothetical protein